MVDDDVLDWLRQVHATRTRTASVCTGALILGGGGNPERPDATTHWQKMGVLRIMGAKPRPEERVVRSGKIVTVGGVTAGVDLALWLAREIAGRAEAIQLVLEYDPQPPFGAGHYGKASPAVRKLAIRMMDESIPPDQSRFVPKIAWRRFIDPDPDAQIARHFSSLDQVLAHISLVVLRFWPSFGSCPISLSLTNSKAVTAALAGPSHNSALKGSIRSRLTSGLDGPSGHHTSAVFRQIAFVFSTSRRSEASRHRIYHD
ncbi:hypothetical protein [Bradyrhizobium diazoefficiens]|uniref:hypothetical protein n=1 Tax=Bradyrhizobium diazoefficiens TaxID=1355477 RepID=UPI003D9ABB2F